MIAGALPLQAGGRGRPAYSKQVGEKVGGGDLRPLQAFGTRL